MSTNAPDLSILAKRLGLPIGPTLEHLILRARELSPDDPNNAFEALGIYIRWIGAEDIPASNIAFHDAVPVDVFAFMHIDGGNDWAGFCRTQEHETTDDMPIVSYLLKTCYHEEVYDEENLLRDFGFESEEELDELHDIERYASFQVVAKDLREYLSLIATLGSSLLCRHLDAEEAAEREVDASPEAIEAATSALLRIPGVARIDDWEAVLRAAPRLKLIFPAE